MPGASPVEILVVEDEEPVRDMLRNLLEREGFVVREARNSAEVRAALKKHTIGLITLDLNLGRENGLALARDIRVQHDVPIIMVTAKADDVDRIIGLELGADDYITKPFNLREVLARIRAVLRRYERGASEQASGKITFGDLALDVDSRELKRSNGELVMLTTAEFKLLEVLAKRPSRVLSRDSLMDLLKGHEATAFDRAIDTLVGRLRKKVEADPETPTLIKTVRGVGYVFTPPSKD
jgi:DNA-binding response OmpR family regulator